MGASSEDEATTAVSQEPLTLPAAMNHQQVVFHKRAASLYFALKSSSKFLFFAMIALVLRSFGFSPLQVGVLRAVSAFSSIMFVEFAMICIRSPKKRKILAHLCLALASANVLAYLVIPPTYEQSPPASLLAQYCHKGNSSLNVNRTGPEVDTDSPRMVFSTEPSPVISVTETSAAANNGTEQFPASKKQTDAISPNFSSFPPASPSLPPGFLPASVDYPAGFSNVPPQFVTQDMQPPTQAIRPNWLKEIIDAQNSGGRLLKTRKRSAEMPIQSDEPSRVQVAQQTSTTSSPVATETPSNEFVRSPYRMIESFWETLTDTISRTSSPRHSFIVACFLLVCIEVYFALTDRISVRLYRNYLDQFERSFDHLPFSHFVTLFVLLATVAVYVRFQCAFAPDLEQPKAALGASGVVLTLSTLVFTSFPVPERRKILDRHSANPVNLTVRGNLRALLVFFTLVVLGAAFGIEQNFIVWHLVENGADIFYVTAFIGIPVLVSALLISRTPRRLCNIHRFLLAALLSVSVRFASYSLFTNNNMKWIPLCLQLVSPASTTILWKAVDSFLQQITFPNDHASISRTMRFAFWGLGFSAGSLMAGYAFQLYSRSFFLLVIGISAGLGAVAFFVVNICVRIQDMKESHYMRILETDHQSKQPINHFQETDDSDDDENVVEFQVETSRPTG